MKGMDKFFQFEVNVSLDDINLGDMNEEELKQVCEKIRLAVHRIQNSEAVREEYKKCFVDEFGTKLCTLAGKVAEAINVGIDHGVMVGQTKDWETLLEKKMPVAYDYSYKDGDELVRRISWADLQNGKWIVDNAVITRNEYETETATDGSVYALIAGCKKLVKAPNVECYKISEDVLSVAELAFKECTKLKELTVPFLINDYELEDALENMPHKNVRVQTYDWSYEHQLNEQQEKEIAEGWTDEAGFVYSKDRKRLLRAPKSFEAYYIPEGVERIERQAFHGCTFEELNIPYTCQLNELPESEFPVFGSERVQGAIIEWDRPYAEQDFIEDALYMKDQKIVCDEYKVRYSENGKRLLSAGDDFREKEYEVPDGVVTICSNAFGLCETFVTLSVPRSIKVIGGSLFGKFGGRIVFR